MKELTSDNLGTYACYDDKEKMIKSFKLKIMFRKVFVTVHHKYITELQA